MTAGTGDFERQRGQDEDTAADHRTDADGEDGRQSEVAL